MPSDRSNTFEKLCAAIASSCPGHAASDYEKAVDQVLEVLSRPSQETLQQMLEAYYTEFGEMPGENEVNTMTMWTVFATGLSSARKRNSPGISDDD